jgi:hypothetical protein
MLPSKPLPSLTLLLSLIVDEQVKRFSESRDLISLANAFSGGVFLSLAFGHMIPHSTHGFEKLVRPLRLMILGEPFVLSMRSLIVSIVVRALS